MMPGHVPVMVGEMVELMAVRSGATYLDGTFGAGHYSRALLAAGAGRVIAIDRDPDAVARGRALASTMPGLQVVENTYGRLDEVVAETGGEAPAGVVFDLGVSSMQLDDPARGFSFMVDGPLDMRMSRSGQTAADLVNELGEGELAGIIRRHGEEPAARKIARAIVRRRARKPFTGTLELAGLVAGAAGGRSRSNHHPATRTFQALRIAVNEELDDLERALQAAERVLVPGGRLVVVAFHSLEDRIVKRFLAERSGRTRSTSRHRPLRTVDRADTFRLLTTRARRPRDEEVAANPRARSAHLRAAERLATALEAA
jgi:16S rRNA (cytosine1402-N4)-methyltransferase